jgi:hypothetical protein
MAALHVYLSAIIAEAAEDIPASTHRDAAAEMRVRENWRAS